MKKVFFLIAAAALMLSSCVKEQSLAEGDFAQVSFGVELENVAQTRGAESTSANRLYYAVFDVDDTLVHKAKSMDIQQWPAKVDISLTKGQEYTIAFFADYKAVEEEATTYSVSDDMVVTVDYSGGINNDDNRDAFYGTYTFTVGNVKDHRVTLTRPFAQLNVGSAAEDWGAAVASGVTITESKATIYGVSTKLNVLTGEVGNAAEDLVKVEYDFGAIPTAALEANDKEYHRLSMSYLLADKSSLHTVEFEFRNATATRIVSLKDGLSNIPLQRNWRTNILGTILTGDVHFDVYLELGFADDHTLPVGDKAFADYVAAINADNSGKKEFVIYLVDDVEWDTGRAGAGANEMFTNPEVTVTINGNGNKITATGQGGIRNKAKLIFNDVTFVDNTAYLSENGETAWEFCYLEFGDDQVGDFTFNNCVFDNTVMFDSANATLVDCVFNGKTTNASNASQEYAAWVASLNSSFTGCTFTDLNRGLKVCKLHEKEKQTMTVDGCTFENISQKPGIAIDCVEGSEITIKNSTFIDVRPGDQSKYIYETDNVTPTLENNEIRVRVSEGVTTDLSQSAYYVGGKDGFDWVAEQINGGNAFAGKTIVLENDITIPAGEVWTPLGSDSKPFKGILDGNDKNISGLKIHTVDIYAGLVAKLNAGAVIKNLTLTNVDVKSDNKNAGAFAGYNDGTILNCHVAGGTVTSDKYLVGGIAGINAGGCDEGIIAACSVEDVTLTGKPGEDGSYAVGGIAGNNTTGAVIIACHTRNVGLANYTYGGGIVGVNSSGFGYRIPRVIGCYSLDSKAGDEKLTGDSNILALNENYENYGDPEVNTTFYKDADAYTCFSHQDGTATYSTVESWADAQTAMNTAINSWNESNSGLCEWHWGAEEGSIVKIK